MKYTSMCGKFVVSVSVSVICKLRSVQPKKGKGHPVICRCRLSREEKKMWLHPIRHLGDREGWVVSTKSLPLQPGRVSNTHCARGWVDRGVFLEGHGKSCSHWNSIPDRAGCRESLQRLSYPGRRITQSVAEITIHAARFSTTAQYSYQTLYVFVS